MRHLADRMGIRAPSLYKHIESKEELEALLIADAFRDFGQVFHDALADGRRSRAARCVRWRARIAAGRWRIRTSTGWSPRAAPARAAAGGPGGVGGRADRDRRGRRSAIGRAAWAFAHGMTILELDGRFRPTPTSTGLVRGIAAFEG